MLLSVRLPPGHNKGNSAHEKIPAEIVLLSNQDGFSSGSVGTVWISAQKVFNDYGLPQVGRPWAAQDNKAEAPLPSAATIISCLQPCEPKDQHKLLITLILNSNKGLDKPIESTMPS